MKGHKIAKLTDVTKRYRSGDETIIALHETNLSIYSNELTLILGPSGSGKTTLLSMLGCVIYPTAGKVQIMDKEVSGMDEKQLAHIRLEKIGFVFQGFNLIQPLNALENVMMPLKLLGLRSTEAKLKAEQALDSMGLSERMYNLPNELSGGQQQRVSIARALVTDPLMILCDEPTASLDTKSIGIVMDNLKVLSRSDRSVVIVTHDERLRRYADRTIYVVDGDVSEKVPDKAIYQ